MDWRRPIEQQKPATRSTQRRGRTIAADDLRRAGRDPDMLEFAIQARAYTERLRREGRKL
jgi:hypothetical protein